MKIRGFTIASQRAQRLRADIDYFDQREARKFFWFKAGQLGAVLFVGAVVIAVGYWFS